MAAPYEPGALNELSPEEILRKGSTVNHFGSMGGTLHWTVNHSKVSDWPRYGNDINARMAPDGTVRLRHVDHTSERPISTARQLTVNELAAFALAAVRDIPDAPITQEVVRLAQVELTHRGNQVQDVLTQLATADLRPQLLQ